MSNNHVTDATIQHPAVKKIKINPGNANSVIKNATPTRNHISDDERIILPSNNLIFSLYLLGLTLTPAGFIAGQVEPLVDS
jgi:hypothetical protein